MGVIAQQSGVCDSYRAERARAVRACTRVFKWSNRHEAATAAALYKTAVGRGRSHAERDA